jgi:hypothetical protein
MRVLVANQPRSYREAIALVLRHARPELEMTALAPDELDDELEREPADLVVCSRATAAVRSLVGSWVELYPENRAVAHACVAGETRLVVDPDLGGLLAIVDAVAALDDKDTPAT